MSTISLLEKLHVGRRLSGSSSKLSLRDEDMEFLDFNINDISRASSPASVSAKSESHLQRDRRHRHSLRGDDEYRRRCHKLKSELEAERDKVKAIHRDKIEEMRQIREYYEEERKLEHAALKKKLEEEKQREVSKLKEELMKVKDYELQQVLKYKEDQLRHYRAYTPGVKTPVLQIPRAPSAMNGNHTPGFDTPKSPRISDRQSPEFTDSLATTSDRQTPGTNGVSLEKEASRPTERTRTLSGTKEQTHSLSELQETGTQTSPLLPVKEWGQYNSLLNANAAQPRKKDDLEQEIEKVTRERDGLEEQYNSKCADYERKAQEFHQMKQDYENELRRVISEYKKVALGNLQKLKIAEHALREGAMSEGDVLHISLANPDKMVIPTLPLSTKETQGQREAQKKDETKRDERERERALQKKVGELQTQTQRLERKIMLLRTENDTLRKKQDDQKSLEEKVKDLKKRNAELATIARRLEEKARALQQENAKTKMKNKEDGSSDSEHLKRMYARQRAKDLAEHAKNMLTKEREIEELRNKCQKLADLLSNGDILVPENISMYEEKEELVNIVKQAAKERLQLEQQLAHIKNKEKTRGDEQDRERQRRELEVANDILHKEIEKLEQALQEIDSVKEELTERTSECEVLNKSVHHLQEQNKGLVDELQSTSAKSAQLAVQVSDLEYRLRDLHGVSEECSTLRLSLSAAQHERESAKEQVTSLQTQVNSLENLVKGFQESAEKFQQVEQEYKDALEQLAAEQLQIEQLQEAQRESKTEHGRVVTELQKQIQDLEAKCHSQGKRQEELCSELEALRSEKGKQEKLIQHLQEQYQLLEVKEKAFKQHQAKAHNSVKNKSPDQLEHLSASHITHEDPAQSEMDVHKELQTDTALNDVWLNALAMKGPIQVCVAKYSYNPFEFSPNENPEAELQLNAGDYVLVLGDMDEDGFFEGELIDGRRGLVPSNFIERVAEEDLADFHAAIALTSGITDEGTHKTMSSPLDSDSEDMIGAPNRFGVLNGRYNNKNSLNNNNNFSKDPPHPQQLTLEKQLNRSILISWQPPEGLEASAVDAYHVYLDGKLKNTIKGSERTKALLEDVESSQNHQVSVRCLSNFGQSKDAQCTMLIGPNALPVPSELRVQNITQNSASVTWFPGNSNCPHAVLLNGHEVNVVRPGVCHHTFTGLTPATVYRVVIATKPALGTFGERHKWTQDKVSCNIEFKTLTVSDIPDPPLNVQAEAGPREETLLLTWLPVTITSSGFSNGAVVTGYAIFADGNRLKEAPGPTNDHIILTKEDFRGVVPKHLTVRTVTAGHQESIDSDAAQLPLALIKELTSKSAHSLSLDITPVANQRKSPAKSVGELGGHETDEEIEAAFHEVENSFSNAFQEAENSSPEFDPQIAEPFADSSSSELSDIPEVEEELGADELHQNGDTSLAISQSQNDRLHKSPKPAPRKLSPSNRSSLEEAEFSPKHFHGQKPDPSQKNGILTAPMIVPAIEITRDSSTDVGTSFEDEQDGVKAAPHDTKAVPHDTKQIPKSSEDSVEKPLPSRGPITHRHHLGNNELSAFRNIEQGRHENTVDLNNSADTNKMQLSESSKVTESTKNHLNESLKKPLSKSDSSLAQVKAAHVTEDKIKQERIVSQGSPHLEENVLPSKPSRMLSAEPEEVTDRDSISGELNSGIDDSTVRLFIALFDYDPVTMSPNVDSLDEELPFREGQILKVYGEKDADGFYRGEANGCLGYIPCNMVSEIHIDDPELVEQLLKESQTTNSLQHTEEKSSKGENHLTPNGIPALPATGPTRRMVALYDYDPQELSPNVDAELELTFKQGEIIYIYGDMDEDGFFSGEHNGVRGLVPSNFLQDAPISDEDEVLESASMVSPSRSQGSMSATSRHSDSATLNNKTRRDRLSLSPSKERTIILDMGNSKDTTSGKAQQTPEDEKHKKKGGLFNKGRSIFKKLTR